MRRRYAAVFAVAVVFVLWSSAGVPQSVFAASPVLDADRLSQWFSPGSADSELAQVWDNARSAGSHQFVASETRVDMRIQGEAHAPDRARLSLRLEADGTSARPIVFYRDGERLALYQQQLLLDRLRERGALPNGVEATVSGPLARATGSGQLWASASGLPIRQMIELDMPGMTEGYDARIRLTIDLSHYGCEDDLPTPVQDDDGQWKLAAPPEPTWATRS